MKKLLLFIFAFISFFSYAQLDREHWFAPMFDGQGNSSSLDFEQYLHLSTNETTPFVARIYSNNVLITQRTISKGNPAVIAIPRANIITRNTSDLHRIINMGIYVNADRPCFANLRFGVLNHTEIITSKGTAGIGGKFYTVVAPNLPTNTGGSTNLGFSASFLATEDNTNVTVNNFKKPLTFNGIGARTNFTFTLNKGQSYIIDGRISNANNRDGFIGATVTADKPITMSNGNFNGQHATTDASVGSDILMDQSVPVDKLGDNFVIIKGYGVIGNNMEGAIIVATEPNTAIYLNDATTAVATLTNPGDFYRVSENNYVSRGNNHYNLHIKTDKNVYIYQLLAGTASGSPQATGGMNYIPPLNCYLPKTIDEISYISRIAQTDSDTRFTTKLNIITEKGATVRVNGVIPAAIYGPYDISNIVANQKWVSYSIPNVTGNITVNSTKAVTAGIASGNGAFGYGGYFAGFSAIPLITKTSGECLPGVRLEVTEGFGTYLWLLKVGATYIPAPGVNNLFHYEPPQAGIYAVQVKQGSCAQLQTQDFKFYNCTNYTNYDYNSCGSETITPTFTLSTQTVDPTTVTLVTPPTKGIVTIATDGKVTYTANPNASGTDTFKYSFCGIGTIRDCETVQITLKMIEKNDNSILQECSTNGIATYNLSLANVSPDPTLIKSYFVTQNGALNDIAAERITAFTNYSSPDTFVYARLENSFGCIATAKIELKSKLAPEVKENLYTKLHCDEDIDGKIDGIYKVTLSTITPIVLVQASNFVVKYYDDPTKAGVGGNDNITGTFSFTADRSIWIRVDAPNGCPSVIKEIQLKTGAKFTLATDPVTVFECDNNLNNSETTTLSKYTNLFTTDLSATVLFFNSLADAQNNTPTTTDAQTITTPRTFYYRFKRPGFCDTIGTLNISLKAPTPTALLDSYTVCAGTSQTLTAESAPTYTKWEWKQGTTVLFTTNTATLFAGVYTVSFTDASGCIFTKNITIVDSPKPVLNIAAYNATLCDSDFDGNSDPVNFNTITPIIVTNFAANSSLFNVRYYLNQADRDAGNGNTIPNLTSWTFSANTTVYVRVESQYCTYVSDVSHQINFKFGTPIPLITAVETFVQCDTDANGTESINLALYRNLFTTDASATVRYFDTLANAQADNPVTPTTQPITGDKTFYYRFKKAGFCDVIGTLHVAFKAATPTALLDSYTVCAGSSITLNAESTYTSWLWKKGTVTVSTTQSATLSAGMHTVSFTNASGCTFTKNITVIDSPKPLLNIAAYNATLCDSNFDGNSDPVNFNTITPIIVPNFAANSSLFNVRYYLNQADRDAGNGNTIPNLTSWTFSANTTVYVRVESPYCAYVPNVSHQINFKFGNSLPLITSTIITKECDDDFDGKKVVDLSKYISQFTTEIGVTPHYFDNLPDANNNTNEIPNPVTIDQSGTYYLRLHKNNYCDVVVKITINIQIPVTSSVLVDKNICPGTTTNLDAGSGFDGYLWSTGETTQIINVPVGEYWVELTTNGCTYKQLVSVKAVTLPEIISVEIKGSTVTVTATGGNPPLQYAMDNFNYQTSNVFTNVRGGDHTVYVISADNCAPVSAEINVIELYNVITPNADGINDVLNYSALLQKEEPFIQIFDRYGKIIFTGDKNNRYSWDGKSFGKTVATGSYWYIMKWREPGSTAFSEFSGWILVKNRE